ncbi:MAG: ABC transporter substrate-binding protein [Cryomorphaceae bacterium]|nr:ABC transporter substrate-binding protein [Cryomorphaceae bacterium]
MIKSITRILFASIISIAAIFLGCDAPSQPHVEADVRTLPWDTVLTKARGTNVRLMMWQGDPNINAYMNDYVKTELEKRFGVNLIIASGQGSQVVSTLMAEQQAGAQKSDLDLMWINGETYFQLREIEALFGPFTESLPNSKYIDYQNPFIARDFQQPTGGFECPWGNVQLCLIYNSNVITDPPLTAEALATWIKANPGRFTIGTDFTGMTFLKSLMINLAGNPHVLDGPFDEAVYKENTARLWAYLNDIKPYLWREGKTFPNAVAPMHQLFSQGELYFTMSNNDGEVENKISTGTLPEHSRAYVLDGGTIQNSHYMGIPALSQNKAGAMVVLNFLISPEAQYRKALPEVWGDGTVLDMNRLAPSMQLEFAKLDIREHVPGRVLLNQKALEEPAAEYMIRLYEDFRTQIVEKQ